MIVSKFHKLFLCSKAYWTSCLRGGRVKQSRSMSGSKERLPRVDTNNLVFLFWIIIFSMSSEFTSETTESLSIDLGLRCEIRSKLLLDRGLATSISCLELMEIL